MRELLTQYVDEQTPEEAPPFEYVERAARGRKIRSRVTAALVTAVVVAGGATLAVIDQPRAEEAPVAPSTTISIDPTVGLLDDGPPPDSFRYGKTVMLLVGEIQITSVRVSKGQPGVLLVGVPPNVASSWDCLPDTVVRILKQDEHSIRVAAYRYSVAPDATDSPECNPLGTDNHPSVIQLDLRQPVDGRTVYAGEAGKRILQY
ncbi:hypothetical protein E1263_27850 [Kribbella antibiotica]|uniref:Uncharacterized protein n=1 Tax=Kribbella antibiotica TaxID=190195 RepID=A0A4R4Z8X8_9ACTN|nr:hypothetical protein [Kribbella antibiotica]TDD53559.1 hypothetical protein E1263_27850 [Kribbella antibiotica]